MNDPLSLLQDRFGLAEFRRGQREVLHSVFAGKDAMAVMPTGGGKSLCYQLPAVARPGIVLVVSPLIALMRDQTEALKRLGIGAGCLHSDQTYEEKRRLFADMAQAKHFLLFLSPERAQKEGFAAWAKKAPLTLFAIDEAHCISQWGPDFRLDYAKLALLRELRPEVPILALTATATPLVLGDIAKTLGLRKPDRHVYGFYRPNLYCQVESADTPEEKLAWLKSAVTATPEGRVLIYCGTRNQTEELASALGTKASGVGYYHAGLEAEERSQLQDEFGDGRLRILTATNAFGMGVDLPDIRLVVHFQMPANVESYYQEIGRAGRDGDPSTCLLLYAKRDKGLQAHFIMKSGADDATQSRRWRALDAITQFAEGGECRHGEILTYFKDTQRIRECGHCDVCDPDSSRRVPAPIRGFVPSVKLRKKKKAAPSAAAMPLSADAKELAERLRLWRRAYAQERDIPAFLVFSDRTLHDLAARRPISLEDLGRVYGFGPKKVEALGPELLPLLRDELS